MKQVFLLSLALTSVIAPQSASAQQDISIYDRFDFPTADGTMTSVHAADVSNITFLRQRGSYGRMQILLKDGSRLYHQFSNVPEVKFTPAENVTRFPVTFIHDYNLELYPEGDAEGATGDRISFMSSHWYVPSFIHIYGDYTGKDYAAQDGFLNSLAEPDCLCPAAYVFSMPFEPVTVLTREWERTLYNGIAMPEIWPPRDMKKSIYAPMPVPYLENIPEVIDVSVGRQLFVDDFLIEETTLERVFHKPVKYEGNPILSAVASDKTTKIPGATAKDGGVWWEPREGRYKMWYEAGWYGKMALAVSDDGLNWTRPDVANGSNIIPSLEEVQCNSSSVVLDYDAPDSERYKLFMRSPNATATDRRGWSFTSADGINWENKTPTGICGDKSTMFYNPFRRRWVYSIRSVDLASEPYGRARYYREHPDFLAGAHWEDDEPVFWCQGDADDKPDPEFNLAPQLYNLNAVAYESMMISMHQILMDENTVASAAKRPKITELKIGFSRDGFHWHRPFRDTFIAASRTEGSWDRGYVQSVGGICGVYGDELRFYYIGFAGGSESVLHSNGATGVAVMRRDGFASMETATAGTLTTRQIKSDSPNFLFVIVDCPEGSLTAEILDADGNILPGFSASECEGVRADSTIARLSWKNADGTEADLASAIGTNRPFRIRFHLTSGKLYAFWLAPSVKGESRGYVGAGGPGYTSNVDDQGTDAY